MEYVVGVTLALAISGGATLVGIDRNRSFYPAMMVVIACLYGLFAVMGGSAPALLIESPIIAAFILLSVFGFKFSLWFVAGALVAHGIFDCIHPHLIENPGVPKWWPMFCMTYDVTAGAYLACLLRRKKRPMH